MMTYLLYAVMVGAPTALAFYLGRRSRRTDFDEGFDAGYVSHANDKAQIWEDGFKAGQRHHLHGDDWNAYRRMVRPDTGGQRVVSKPEPTPAAPTPLQELVAEHVTPRWRPTTPTPNYRPRHGAWTAEVTQQFQALTSEWVCSHCEDGAHDDCPGCACPDCLALVTA